MTAESIWVPIAGGRYVGSTPNPVYPLYTRGNAGEVFPEVVYPLTFSTSAADAQQAWERAVMATGLFSAEEFAGQQAMTFGTFGGYMYLNLSMARVATRRLPGAKVEDLDGQLFGLSQAPPYRPVRSDRSWRASARALRYLVRTVRAKDLPVLAADAATVRAWQQGLPDLSTATDGELRAELERAQELGATLFEHHLFVSNQAAVAGAVIKLCRDQLGDEALGLRLITGLGDVESAAPSWALWDLGRLARRDPAVSAQFEAGPTDLERRLRTDPAAEAFMASFDRFLAEHGSRGPNEWESACHTWGTRPELALALVDRMRRSPEGHDPRRRHAVLAADRAAARAELEVRAKRAVRWQLHLLLDSAALYLQGRERAKTTVVKAIHVGRLILRELGGRCAARARDAGVSGAEVEDIWFVVADELDDFLADPARFAPLIAERRAMRERLAERIPPFVFDGEPPPWESWPMRADVEQLDRPGDGDTIAGIAGAPGVATGRARVVLHPADAADLEPGEILVAPITDPSWTPLFVPAVAVVVDVGALLSHAVIVARELGIPAVVSATDASRRLRSGDEIRVDGSRGIVTVLRAAPALDEPSPAR